MTSPPIRNLILNRLYAGELERVRPSLEWVALPVRFVMETPRAPFPFVYFVETGIVSVVATGPKHVEIEVAVVGFEGCTGIPVVLGGDRSPLSTYVQIAGSAHRIACSQLSLMMGENSSLDRALRHYVQVYLTQIAQTALANGRAKLEERLARWLLMAQDRLETTELPLTHEFLAMMLAVRRPGVTVALALLRDQGHIAIHRGLISIIDREGLALIADKFYGVPEAEAKRLFTSP